MNTICNFLSFLNNLLWGDFTLLAIISAAVYLTFRCKFFYFRHPLKIMQYTLFSNKRYNQASSNTLSPFQTLTTSLAASMGTGNIIGVAAAISIGGSGAILWMILSAFLVMSFAFTENYLATDFKNRSEGKSSQGVLLYFTAVFDSILPSLIFCVICMLSSFVIGNLTQVNSASASLDNFNISPVLIGIAFALLTAFSVLHPRTSIVKISEKLVPFLAVFYVTASLIIILTSHNISKVLIEILNSAFEIKAIGGGIFGFSVSNSMSVGLRRGLFSNEAGMGTSPFAHTSTDCPDPKIMGIWAVLEVFIDTVLLCSLPALVILCTDSQNAPFFGADIVINAFKTGFKKIPLMLFSTEIPTDTVHLLSDIFSDIGAIFIAIANAVFAFASVIGWYFYGEKCCLFLNDQLGISILKPYKYLYILTAFAGAVIKAKIIWELADIFTFFMLIPNLFAIIVLSKSIKIN